MASSPPRPTGPAAARGLFLAASARKGARILPKLQTVAEGPSVFRGARGIGLLMAVELARLADLAAVERACFEGGLHLGSSEGRFLCLSLPFTSSDSDLDLAVEILSTVAGWSR